MKRTTNPIHKILLRYYNWKSFLYIFAAVLFLSAILFYFRCMKRQNEGLNEGMNKGMKASIPRETTPNTEKQWHEYIDVIYYINLDHREDRKSEIVEELTKMGVPDDKIIRIPAVNKPGKGDWGCSISHMNALSQFLDSGLKNCIVLEDDFAFTQPLKKVNQLFREVFDKNIIYDVIMLSSNEIEVRDTKHAHLKKVISAQTASGYMVNAHFAPVLYQNFRDGAKLIGESYQMGKSDELQGPFCVDQYWKRLQPQSNWYMFHPKLGVQRKSHSDIQGGIVDYGV